MPEKKAIQALNRRHARCLNTSSKPYTWVIYISQYIGKVRSKLDYLYVYMFLGWFFITILLFFFSGNNAGLGWIYEV